MRTVQVTGPDTVDWVEQDKPTVGPRDVLLKMRACGICGSDGLYTMHGGIPPRIGATPLGHEPAAEVVEIGAEVTGIEVGAHVVIDTFGFTDGLLGSGGAQDGLSEFVVVRDFEPGRTDRDPAGHGADMPGGATLEIVAVHKKPVEVDFGGLLTTERTIVWAMGYPTEIFEVTDDIVENWEKYQVIMGDVFPYERARGPGSRTHAGCNRQGCGADFLGPRVESLSRRASACAARRP